MVRVNPKNLSLLFLTLILCAACGKKAAQQPNPFLWTEPQIQGRTDACVRGVLGDPPDETLRSTASAYCRCMMEAAATRWNYETFLKDPDVHLRELESDEPLTTGCVEKANKTAQGTSP